jgi:hypothetical protein
MKEMRKFLSALPPPPPQLLYSSLLLLPVIFALAIPFAGAQENDERVFPYTLGAGIEGNLNTREGFALGYGIALDRHVGSEYILAGLRGAMGNDFNGVTETEASLYLRLYLFKPDAGGVFTQLGWGFTSFREDETHRQDMLLDFTLGYRLYFLNGFYVEPYFRTGFPLRAGMGVMAGHWFDF